MILAGSRRALAFSIAVATAFAVANACASEPDIVPRQLGGRSGSGGGSPDSSTAGGTSGAGGGVGSSGASGAGGSSGAAGTGGSSGATGTGGSDGGCVPHMGGPPILDPATLPKCTLAGNPSCTDARCLQAALVPEGSRASLAPCADPAQLCVPDFFIAAGGNFVPPTCRSLLDAEGRCLSMCIPQISSQVSLLPQSTCAATERCAPCYDPRTGMDTGACKQSCDTGPKEAGKSFPECCNALGRCVPNTLIPESERSQLGKDSCSGATELCAPKAQVIDPTSKPKSCTTFPPQNREGRCLPACLPSVSGRASQLRKEDCAEGELCAPCYDPVNGGSTGACGINGDMPAQPDPGAFVRCEAVATIILVVLPVDVPLGEGRCVPPYLAGSQASILKQTTCLAGEVCAPCVNPLGDGGPQPTGACPSGDGGTPRDAGPG
jgi:hypothetical protein